MKQAFDSSQPSEQPTARRKALKKLLVGSGAAVAASQTLPAKWTKPVVDSVILPAHAQTTVVPTTPAPTTTLPIINFRGQFSVTITPINSIDQPQEGLYAAILNTVIPNAHAGGLPQDSADMCIEVNGTNFTATLAVLNNGSFLTASGVVGGGAVDMVDVNNCIIGMESIAVNSVSASSADFTLSGTYASSGTLSVGSGCPSEPLCSL